MCDHRPSTESKWRKAKILSRLGPLTYKVISDQQTRTAHVDHLLSADGTVSGKEQLTTETKHDPKPRYSCKVNCNFTSVDHPEVENPGTDLFQRFRTLTMTCFFSLYLISNLS